MSPFFPSPSPSPSPSPAPAPATPVRSYPVAQDAATAASAAVDEQNLLNGLRRQYAEQLRSAAAATGDTLGSFGSRVRAMESSQRQLGEQLSQLVQTVELRLTEAALAVTVATEAAEAARRESAESRERVALLEEQHVALSKTLASEVAEGARERRRASRRFDMLEHSIEQAVDTARREAAAEVRTDMAKLQMRLEAVEAGLLARTEAEAHVANHHLFADAGNASATGSATGPSPDEWETPYAPVPDEPPMSGPAFRRQASAPASIAGSSLAPSVTPSIVPSIGPSIGPSAAPGVAAVGEEAQARMLQSLPPPPRPPPPPLNLQVPHHTRTISGRHISPPAAAEVERRATFDKELGDLVADLSHHIATPLAGARRLARSGSVSDMHARA